MTRGSNIVDEIRRHIHDCKTCWPLHPNGGDDPNTQQALRECATYRSLHRDWKRWIASPD